MAMDKRNWINIGLGTIAAIAIIFGVKQCSDKKTVTQEAEEWHNLVVKNGEEMTKASSAVAAANDRINELNDDNSKLARELNAKDSTILQLTDSLVVVNKKLNDCENGKAKKDCGCRKQQPAKKAPAKKPVAKKPAPAKPAAKPAPKPAPAKPCKPVEPTVCDQKPVVYVARDTVAVVKPTPKPAEQTVVVNGDNTGTIIVNSNGNVCGNTVVNGNNNAVVNGNNNVVNNNTVTQQQLLEQYTCGRNRARVASNRRVRCH